MLFSDGLKINDACAETTSSFKTQKNWAAIVQSIQNEHTSLVQATKMLTSIVFAIGLVMGIAIGSATSISALTQGAPDILQSWAGVVAMP